MGNNNSKQSTGGCDDNFFRSQFEESLEKPSVFYDACKEGNITILHQHLPIVSREKIVRQVEPNGETALHAAARAGHASVVALLLANGFSRTAINREGKTAYETACNDNIRRLFHRSASERLSRFHDEDCERIVYFNDGEEQQSNGS